MADDHTLVEVADGCWAYLQRDGSWGWSNAGLIAEGEASLLVDTLFDLPLTAAMLATMRDAVPGAANIGAVVNTHANGDHCWGNQFVEGATIVASQATAAEMLDAPQKALTRGMWQARMMAWLPWPLSTLPAMGGATVSELSEFFEHAFGAFDFGGITLTPPDRTFTGSLPWRVGDTEVDLIEVGPAHTRGDTIVHLPAQRVVYTGDILFSSGHPIVWEGPVASWMRACERIEALAPDVVVPGHGPLATLDEVVRCRRYLGWLTAEVRPRHEAGMGDLDIALDLDLADWRDWGEEERVAANVHALCRELRGESGHPNPLRVFGLMAAFRARTIQGPRT